MKKEWIGKVGNTAYMLNISDADIFPQGFELSLKFMDNALWLDGFSKQSLDKSIKELDAFIGRLYEAQQYMRDFVWDEEKEKKHRDAMRSLREGSLVIDPPKKVKKAKKASGA